MYAIINIDYFVDTIAFNAFAHAYFSKFVKCNIIRKVHA